MKLSYLNLAGAALVAIALVTATVHGNQHPAAAPGTPGKPAPSHDPWAARDGAATPKAVTFGKSR